MMILDATPPEMQAALEKHVVPVLMMSPAAKSDGGKEKTTLSGVEALVIIAGQMNRNGYSVREVIALPLSLSRVSLCL